MQLGLGLGLGVGKSSGPIIIGAGPLASAPAASAANQNMYYASTDFGVVRYISSPAKIDDGIFCSHRLRDESATPQNGSGSFVFAGCTNQTSAFNLYASANDVNGVQILNPDNLPKLGVCTFLNGIQSSIVINGSSSFLPYSSDWTASIWGHLDIGTSGYLFGKSGATPANRTGLYCDPGGTISAYVFGTLMTTTQAIGLTRPHFFTLRWNSAGKVASIFYDGVKVKDQTIETSTVNALPLMIGQRFSDDVGMSKVFPLTGRVRDFRIWSKALTDNQIYGAYYNSEFGHVTSIVGSSTAQGIGATPFSNAWVCLNRDIAKTRNTQILNFALGGTTFYVGAPTGYVKPAYVTGVRPAPDITRNISRAIDLGADVVIYSFASNFSQESVNYTEGPFVYSEYLACVEHCKTFCDSSQSLFFACTPQPLASGYPSGRRAIQKAVAEEVIKLEYGIDFYTTHSDAATNSLLQIYDVGDGMHQNNLGHADYANISFVESAMGCEVEKV